MADNIVVGSITYSTLEVTNLNAAVVPAAHAQRIVMALRTAAGTAVDLSQPLTDTQLRASAVPVSGTFFQATQPVSNAGTFAVQAAQAGAWNVTNITGTVSLPTGAATAAKQPALGTAGTASADVLTVQGAAGMTALKVDGSAVTQPVSIGAVVNVADNGGSLTVDAPVATPVFVRLSDGTAAIATLPVSLSTLPALVAGSAIVGKVGIDQTTPGTTNRVAGGDSLGAVQYNFPAGFVRTSDEPRQLFYDHFDGTLDVTDLWSATVAAGGGVAASTTAGVMTLGSGTTINGYSYLFSRATFKPTIPAWIQNSWAVQVEAGATAGNNAVRFWGAGSVGGTPSSASPLGATGNGYGFELDTAGVLQAVVYAAGVRTVVASLAASQPTDGAYHRYLVVYRTDRTYWYIDSLATPVATSNFQSPTVQTLPLLALAVAHTAAPAASRVFTCAGVAVADTGKGHAAISDGNFAWRKATVKPGSTAAAASDSPLVVALHPTSPVAQAAITKGTQGTTGVTTQDLKDAGRQNVLLFWDYVNAAIGTTALTNFTTGTRNAAALAAANNLQVTAGKTLRITQIIVSIAATSATRPAFRCQIRQAAAVANTSPVIWESKHAIEAIGTLAADIPGHTYDFPIPDGLEIAAGQQIAFTILAAAAQGKASITVLGFEY